MLNIKRFLIVIIISLAAFLFGMIFPGILSGPSARRTLDNLYTAWSYGFVALIVGLAASIFLILKVSASKINRILLFAGLLLVVEIIFIVLRKIFNW